MEDTDSTRTTFLKKIPGFPVNSREFQTEFVEKGVMIVLYRILSKFPKIQGKYLAVFNAFII